MSDNELFRLITDTQDNNQPDFEGYVSCQGFAQMNWKKERENDTEKRNG